MLDDLNILHEDEHLLVLDKPGGISFLSERHGGEALWPVLTSRWNPLYPVHRLDKGTSGVLLLAKSRVAQTSLNRQFQSHVILKNYLAMVAGTPDPPSALIDLPLVKGRKNSYRIAALRSDIGLGMNGLGSPVWRVTPGKPLLKGGGFPAMTRYRVLSAGDGYTFVLLRPLTGRTHQIRVHMGWIGHPLLGDGIYNRDPESRGLATRLALHCHRMSWRDDWTDPASSAWRSVSSTISEKQLLGQAG